MALLTVLRSTQQQLPESIAVLKRETYLGRDPTCDVHLTWDGASRKHAVLRGLRADGGNLPSGWEIEDLSNGRSNGVFVNNVRVVKSRLREGDVIGFGRGRDVRMGAAIPDSHLSYMLVLRSVKQHGEAVGSGNERRRAEAEERERGYPLRGLAKGRALALEKMRREADTPSQRYRLCSSAVYPPSGWTPPTGPVQTPTCHLELEFINGYHGNGTFRNGRFLRSGEIVYFVAATVVIMEASSTSQRFYFGHDDDVSSIATHPDGDIVASGQVGKQPAIYVWSASKLQTLVQLAGFHTRSVDALCFNRDGSLLSSVGGDDFHSVAIYRWRAHPKPVLVASSKGHGLPLYSLVFNPYVSGDSFVTVGENHIKFWQLSTESGRTTLVSKNGVSGKLGSSQKVWCIAFSSTGHAAAGVADGDIYFYEAKRPGAAHEVTAKISSAHAGGTTALTWTPDGLVSSGKDGLVCLWNVRDRKHPLMRWDLRTVCVDGLQSRQYGTSLDHSQNRLLVGTAANDLLSLDMGSDKLYIVVRGHAGSVRAVAAHPSKPTVYYTAGADRTVRAWDASRHTLIKARRTGVNACGIAVSNNGDLIAVTGSVGEFVVLDSTSLEELAHNSSRQEAIDAVAFSPDDRYLAVASHDNFIDIYSVADGMKRVGVAKGHSSYLKQIDFSEDGRSLQSVDGANELLYWEVPKGTRIPSASMLRDEKWATLRCTHGWSVQGIWKGYADGTDINACDRSSSRKHVVVADDKGKVKLYRYPVWSDKAPFREYIGHSSHVLGVRWVNNDTHVVSVGGPDLATFQWRAKPGAPK